VDRATQDALIKRLEDSEYERFSIDHGYCTSVYVTDPDGLRLEFTLDADDIEDIKAEQLTTAHATLKEWMNGRRVPNNKPRDADVE